MLKLHTSITGLLFFLMPLLIQAQTFDKLRQKTYDAYVKGKQDLWEEAIDIVTREYQVKQDSATLYEFILVQYGYTSFCVDKKHKEKGLSLIEGGHANVDRYMEIYPDDPGAIALKAALLVFEATLKPMKFISLGAESVKLTNLAYELDNSNMMALSGKANQLRFSPSVFGGSIDESIPLYERIISHYDDGIYQALYDWRYINTLVILAGSYEEKEMFEEACRVYEKIIAFDSSINWVTNGLYPECRKKAGIHD